MCKLDLLAQVAAAIAIFLIPGFRARKMKPLRGFVFSFMASSSFYPIIVASFQHGYRQMDLEAGATRYALTVLTYLLAVTTYAVSVPTYIRGNRPLVIPELMCGLDETSRSMETRNLRYLGTLTPDLSRLDGSRANHPFHGLCQGF